VAQTEPSGGHVLGIIFEDASVFHCVDLNLMTVREYQAAGSFERFGAIKELYQSDTNPTPGAQDQAEIASEIEDPDEARIKVGIHFTKKAAKKVLRGEDALADLRQWAAHLKLVMADYPVVADRPIVRLAQIYVEIADLLLQNDEPGQHS
jgi:hypothetical protein